MEMESGIRTRRGTSLNEDLLNMEIVQIEISSAVFQNGKRELENDYLSNSLLLTVLARRKQVRLCSAKFYGLCVPRVRDPVYRLPKSVLTFFCSQLIDSCSTVLLEDEIKSKLRRSIEEILYSKCYRLRME